MERYRQSTNSNFTPVTTNIWQKLAKLHPGVRIAIFAVLFMVVIYIIKVIFCDKTDTSRWTRSPLTGVDRTVMSQSHPCIMGENGSGIFVSGYPAPVLGGVAGVAQRVPPNLREDHCSGPPGSYSWWKDLMKFEKQKIDAVNAFAKDIDPAWWHQDISTNGNTFATNPVRQPLLPQTSWTSYWTTLSIQSNSLPEVPGQSAAAPGFYQETPSFEGCKENTFLDTTIFGGMTGEEAEGLLKTRTGLLSECKTE